MLDSARSSFVKKIIEQHPIVERLGTIHSLSLNAKDRTCSAEIGLKGELSPVRFSAKYEFISDHGETEVRISEIFCEKPWIHEILKLVLEEKGGELRFALPGLASKLATVFF